jgi:hypothetical protein
MIDKQLHWATLSGFHVSNKFESNSNEFQSNQFGRSIASTFPVPMNIPCTATHRLYPANGRKICQ